MQWRNSSAFIDAARQPPELMHYGIRGQKWGVRNYQNEDGSLTPAGKQRYGGNQNGRGGLFGLHKKKEKKRDWKPEDAENLSDEELRTRNNRLQAEQNYKNNMTPQWKKDAKQTAKSWRNEAIKNIFIGTAVTLAAAAMTKNYKKIGPLISKYSKIAVSKIHSNTSVIKNAANKYSNPYIGNMRPGWKTRIYDNRRGSPNGIRKSMNWPTISIREKKNK